MSSAPITASQQPDYAWEVATLFPEQGSWSEEEYLHLTDGTNRLIELTDGQLEFLPMPTEFHQEVLTFLYHALYGFVKDRRLGKVHFSGLRLRIRPRKIRQPDVIFLHKDHYHMRHNRIWDGADLVMEVVSDDPKDRERDFPTKLADFAEGKVAEHWIVDPDERVIHVHRLEQEKYTLHGRFREGEQAASALLPGFAVNVTEVFAALDDIPE